MIAQTTRANGLKTGDEYIAAPHYACSDDLAALLENLRANQSLFFRTKNGTIDHANAFQESKRLEKELDQFLKARKEEKAQAPNLFSL